MTERPILFSGPMVRALLDGRKTQTRRVVKLDVPIDADDVFFWSGEELRRKGWRNVSEPGLWARKNGRDGYIKFIGRCPYGVPGDRLWVRESGLQKDGPLFKLFTHDATPGRYWADTDGGRYGAPYGPAITRDSMIGAGWKVRPSIHMPRWASRLTLEITDVRVERLQDISPVDAVAEGLREFPCEGPHRGPDATYWTAGEPTDGERFPLKRTTPVEAYKALWEHINGWDSWNANSWVWAVSFRVQEPEA